MRGARPGAPPPPRASAVRSLASTSTAMSDRPSPASPPMRLCRAPRLRTARTNNALRLAASGCDLQGWLLAKHLTV